MNVTTNIGQNTNSILFSEPHFLTRRVEHYHTQRAVNPVEGGHLLQGGVPTKKSVVLVSNDYLSISGHPEIVSAQTHALSKEGNGVLRSGVFNFGGSPQRNLERKISSWSGSEDALLCQSGWCANVGLVQSIANRDTPVYVDMMAHMSLWEGIKSAGAEPHPFRHNNVESLENLIQKHGVGVILVDSVYSTIGDRAPLAEIAEISSRYGCVLVVDESHSLGLFGPQGSGLVVELGLLDSVHFRTASLSKSFAARGGVVLGRTRNIEYIRYEALPTIFSSGILPHEIVGFMATLEVIKKAEDRRDRLHNNSKYLHTGLAALGFPLPERASHIVALVAGPEHRSIVLRDALEQGDIFGSPFCAPATPKNRSLIRLSVNSGLTREKMDRVIEVCGSIRDEIGLEQWPNVARHGTTNATAVPDWKVPMAG